MMVVLALLLAGPARGAPRPDRTASESVAIDRSPIDRRVVLSRGVNLTNWFRYPASLEPASLRGYLSDAAIVDLRRAGFSFVRLAVQPAILLPGNQPDPQRLSLLLDAVRRLQRHGLGVVIVPFSTGWQLEDKPEDRAALLRFWHVLAPALGGLEPKLTFPELLNEPVFAHDAAAWARLQATLLAEVRKSLPRAAVILTGQDWGSIAGLQALTPVPDANVVYSIHFYDPSELTSLAAYRPGLDQAALARLPFPMDEAAACTTAAATRDTATAGLIAFVCAMHWDAEAIRRLMVAAGDWSRRHHATVLLGEFGASVRLNGPARLAWLTAVRQAAEQQGIGWALWGYDDGMGLDLPRPPGPRPALDGAVLGALGLNAVRSPSPLPGRSAR